MPDHFPIRVRLGFERRSVIEGDDMSRAVIDKASRVPYYEQLREILDAAIRSGKLAVGDQLPSEAQLCDHYDVSRTVVRQALNELANEGLIVRYKGKGSFVAPPKVDEHLAQSLTGLAEEVRARGEQLTNKIRTFEVQAPSAHVAEMLKLGIEDSVIHLERVRSINGEPWVLTSTYLPHEHCASLLELDMRHRSLYVTLERELGLVLDHGHRTIEAALATAEQARLLGIAAGDPVLLLKSLAFLADGTPIEYFLAWHRGDRSRFDVDLARDPERSRGVGHLTVGEVGAGNSAGLVPVEAVATD
jgi:GntR family transcriptional regulator